MNSAFNGDLYYPENSKDYRLVVKASSAKAAKDNETFIDVAKACHHGSHHVDYDFLRGVGALSTVFSSGDANSFDHPRAWVLGAAALAGRVIEDPNRARLKAPLVYSTEIARSIDLSKIDQLRELRDGADRPFLAAAIEPRPQLCDRPLHLLDFGARQGLL